MYHSRRLLLALDNDFEAGLPELGDRKIATICNNASFVVTDNAIVTIIISLSDDRFEGRLDMDNAEIG